MADALTDEKIRLAQEIRSIQERDMGQPQRAFLAAGQAFAQNVDRPGARADLERLARVTGSYEELARDLRAAWRRETRGPDPDKAAWLRRAAELREHLAQSDDAIRDWQALLADAPQDRQALDALGKLYEQTKNAKQLSEVTLRKAQLAADPARAPRPCCSRPARRWRPRPTTPAPSTPSRRRWRSAGAPDGLEALDRLYARGKRLRGAGRRPGPARRLHHRRGPEGHTCFAAPSCSSGRRSCRRRWRATRACSPSRPPTPTRSPGWSG